MSRFRIPTLLVVDCLAGLVAGMMIGALQGGWNVALAGGIVGGVIGLIVDPWVRRATRIGERSAAKSAANRNVRRPDLWGIPFSCLTCEWKVGPVGPWRVRDASFPPQACPRCDGPLQLVVPDCPECGAAPKHTRLPTSWRQAIWGGYTCGSCGTDFDKWGRRQDPSGSSEP